jgi:hypothetical protein
VKTVAAALALVGSVYLYPGYVTKVECTGKLLVSAVGNEALVVLSALPQELGCGVLLKPLGPSGRTNLILETSTGSIERVIEIAPKKTAPVPAELTYFMPGGKP